MKQFNRKQHVLPNKPCATLGVINFFFFFALGFLPTFWYDIVWGILDILTQMFFNLFNKMRTMNSCKWGVHSI